MKTYSWLNRNRFLFILTVTSLLIAGMLMCQAQGGGTLVSNCTTCTLGDEISFTGSGYPPHNYVQISVTRASSPPFPISAPIPIGFLWQFVVGQADTNGNIAFSVETGPGFPIDRSDLYHFCSRHFKAYNSNGIRKAVDDVCIGIE